MVHLCPWDCRRCVRDCCGSVDSSGAVVVCRRHGNPRGYFLPRKVGGSGLSLIQLWAFARKHRGGI